MKTNRKTLHSCLRGLLCCLSLWIGQAQAQSPSGDGFYLSFPLANRTAQNAAIISVFDHSNDGVVKKDGVVIAYTGERGALEYGGASPDGENLRQSSGADFIINGNYHGVGYPNHRDQLCYDGHDGIDFKTTEQDQDPVNGEINVFAAADGNLSWIPNSSYNTIEIDHTNGYKTRYLHLSSRTAGLNGTHVNRGQLIGVSGKTSPTPIGPHLHFAVLLNDTLVDPYGWAGVGADPYTAEVSVNLWNPPSQGAAATAALPTLGYIRQGNNLVLSWPTNDSAFMLYYTTNLFASSWISNQVSPSVVDGQYTVTNATTGDNKFYRLQK